MAAILNSKHLSSRTFWSITQSVCRILFLENKKEAFKWFKISAEQGMAFGMINVASFLRLGTGVEQDLKEAFKWYNIAVLSYKKMVNYRFADVWEYEVIPGIKEHIREIKITLQSTDIFEIAKSYIDNTTIQSIYITTNGSLPDRALKFVKDVNLYEKYGLSAGQLAKRILSESMDK